LSKFQIPKIKFQAIPKFLKIILKIKILKFVWILGFVTWSFSEGGIWKKQ